MDFSPGWTSYNKYLTPATPEELKEKEDAFGGMPLYTSSQKKKLEERENKQRGKYGLSKHHEIGILIYYYLQLHCNCIAISL